MRRLLFFAALSLLFAGCITIPQGSDCGGKPDQGQRESCYADAAFAAAIIHNDTGTAISMCGQIEASASPFGSDRDLCFMRIAEVLKNPAICENIESSGVTKSLCISKATPVRTTSVCATAAVLPAIAALALFAYYRRN